MKEKNEAGSVRFQDFIDEHIESERRSDSHVNIVGKYSPSVIKDICVRRSYFNAIAESIEWPADKLRLFKAGDVIHDFAAKVLRSVGRYTQVEAETRFLCVVPHPRDLVTVSGRADVVAMDNDGQTVVFEFKSIYSLRFVTEAPNIIDVRQLQLYLGCLHAQKGYVVYIEKQTLNSVTHEVRYNHKLFMELIEAVKTLHEFVVKREVPLMAYSRARDRFPCDYCNFVAACRKADEDEETRAALGAK